MDPKEAVDQGLISLLQLKSLIVAQRLYRSLQSPYEHTGVRGLWFYGAPGTGKSREARLRYPEAYLKLQNKWFDGYVSQAAIILDDLDRSGICLGHHLKIWTDRYPCTGETKGGHVNLVHSVFVVTSNYTPEMLWSDDQEICLAIRRRFQFTAFRH